MSQITMSCEELLKAMNEYVDGSIDPELCRAFADHLAGCTPCQVVIDNIRKTITLYKEGQRFELPPEFQRALDQQLRAKWKQHFPGAATGDEAPGKARNPDSL